jgi:predicted DNA-binding antitoxin AbrB/MazE fold protein
MTHNIDAIFDQGVFRPIEPLNLPAGTRVHLRIEKKAMPDGAEVTPNHGTSSQNEIPTLLERLKDFVGVVEDLPPDASVNLDHYLYGTPKRK